ncbi:hypothetical protein [Brevundimonas sp. SL130]|uniref:hypothetical protein n=1 Tax=Brevundimonas sp. SL130 TaxID=2995143 RepID=UPI00226CF539|nr:hypothetical protein [Brevundimonas sp. SL130]WAC59146.1 hypothetical protein OU998_13095 [Brevundimonas sp. SL130]
MLNVGYAIAGAIFMVAMVLFAFLKGGSREKIGAGYLILAWFTSLLVQEDNDFRGMPIGMFVIDLFSLAFFAALAWRAPQSWPVWVTGLQLITVMGHIMILTMKTAPITSLYTVMNLIGYLIIGFIGVGTFWVWQDHKAAAEYEQRTAR